MSARVPLPRIPALFPGKPFRAVQGPPLRVARQLPGKMWGSIAIRTARPLCRPAFPSPSDPGVIHRINCLRGRYRDRSYGFRVNYRVNRFGAVQVLAGYDAYGPTTAGPCARRTGVIHRITVSRGAPYGFRHYRVICGVPRRIRTARPPCRPAPRFRLQGPPRPPGGRLWPPNDTRSNDTRPNDTIRKV